MTMGSVESNTHFGFGFLRSQTHTLGLGFCGIKHGFDTNAIMIELTEEDEEWVVKCIQLKTLDIFAVINS